MALLPETDDLLSISIESDTLWYGTDKNACEGCAGGMVVYIYGEIGTKMIRSILEIF